VLRDCRNRRAVRPVRSARQIQRCGVTSPLLLSVAVVLSAINIVALIHVIILLRQIQQQLSILATWSERGHRLQKGDALDAELLRGWKDLADGIGRA